jgi:hypothetical protein
MTNSKQIAGLIGPTLVALGITEAMNLSAFAGNTAAVVYFNGTVLFVAGLAIVRAHNRWARDWTVLVTLTGWVLLVGGLYRMIAPQAPQAHAGIAASVMFAVIFLIGAFLSYCAFVRD